MVAIYGLIYTTIEADKTFYLYLIKKFNCIFYIKKSLFFQIKVDKKLFLAYFLKCISMVA